MKEIDFKKIEHDRAALLKALESRNYQERIQASFYLGELRDRSVIPQLQSKLNDPVPLVIKAVAMALQKIGIDADLSQEIDQALAKVERYEGRLRSKKQENWKPITEEEKQAQLLKYASENHIRAARKKQLNVRESKNKNWLIASVVIGAIILLGYILEFLR